VKPLTQQAKTDKIAVTEGGWISCPICGYKRLKRVRPDETAVLVYIHCRQCKNDIPIELKQGQCFQSQGQQ